MFMKVLSLLNFIRKWAPFEHIYKILTEDLNLGFYKYFQGNTFEIKRIELEEYLAELARLSYKFQTVPSSP